MGPPFSRTFKPATPSGSWRNRRFDDGATAGNELQKSKKGSVLGSLSTVRHWRRASGLLWTAIVSFGPIGCGERESALELLKRSGSVTIAVADAPPWMMLQPDGTPGGVGPEIDRAVLELMGVREVAAVIMEYGSLIPALQAKRATMVSSGGLYILPARCESVLFSDPITCSGEGFILPVGLASKVKSYEDVRRLGLRIGVCAGCFEQRAAAEAGIEPENQVIFPDPTSGMKLLLDGRIDVLAHDDATVKRIQRSLGDDAATRAIDVEGQPISCSGAAFRRDEAEVRDAFNEALREIVANGTFLKILEKHGMEEEAVGRDAFTTAELCDR